MPIALIVIVITANRGDSANTDHQCSLKADTGWALETCHNDDDDDDVQRKLPATTGFL